MGITLLTAIQRVSRNVGLDATITGFSEFDETLDLVQDINEAYEELLLNLPDDCPYLTVSGALTLIPGTRLYSLPSDARDFNVYEWAFIDSTDNYNPLQLVTLEYIVALDPHYDSTAYTAPPAYVYIDGSDQVGIYPVPSTAATITYRYEKTYVTRLSNTTDTFLLPDEWIKFVTKRAQAKYETRKGYANAGQTAQDADDLAASIVVDCWGMTGSYLIKEIY